MASARVELMGSLSHEARGRKFKKGEAQTLTNESDISYYEGQPEFSVTRLKEMKPAKPKAAKADEGEEDDEEEDEEPQPAVHTDVSLNKLTKGQLVTLAAGNPFNLALDNEMTKAEMIKHILDAQNTGDEGADDDDNE